MGKAETEQELYGGGGEIQERDTDGGSAGNGILSMTLLNARTCLIFFSNLISPDLLTVEWNKPDGKILAAVAANGINLQLS